MDLIDIIRINSKRLLIVLCSKQFYSSTMGFLVCKTMMFDKGKISSVLQISTMQSSSTLTPSIIVVHVDVLG